TASREAAAGTNQCCTARDNGAGPTIDKPASEDCWRAPHSDAGVSGEAVALSVIDDFDHGVVGIVDVAELRLVLRPFDRLAVPHADLLEVREEAVPVFHLHRVVKRRHAA